MGECEISPTPGCIIAHVCRPGQVLMACGGIPHRPWLCYTKAILNQKHLHKSNLQLTDSKGLQFCSPVPRHTSLECGGKGTWMQTEEETALESKEGLKPAMGGLFFHAKIFSPWANLRYKQAHKCMAKQRHSAVAHTKRVSCALTPAQMPWSWAETSLLPAETSHFAEQTRIPALRHAAILHAEEKPRQKEGSLQFCTSLQIELKPRKSGGFFSNCRKDPYAWKTCKKPLLGETSPLAEYAGFQATTRRIGGIGNKM